jgi:hypothetical protein
MRTHNAKLSDVVNFYLTRRVSWLRFLCSCDVCIQAASTLLAEGGRFACYNKRNAGFSFRATFSAKIAIIAIFAQ